jgi:predicted dehydrogenase
VQVNWVTPVKIRTLSVIGSMGYAELNYITQTLQLYRRQHVEPQISYRDLVATYGEAERETVHAGGEEPLKAELRAFFEAVANGTDPEAGGAAGLAAVELADAALGIARQVSAL